MVHSQDSLFYIWQDFSRVFIISLGFFTWICQKFISLLAVKDVMHEADMLIQSGAPGRVMGWTNLSR